MIEKHSEMVLQAPASTKIELDNLSGIRDNISSLTAFSKEAVLIFLTVHSATQ